MYIDPRLTGTAVVDLSQNKTCTIGVPNYNDLNPNIIRYTKLDERAIAPQRANECDAGLDLFSVECVIVPSILNVLFKYIINRLKRWLSKDGNEECIECKNIAAIKVKTGIAIEIPIGYFGMICDRSSKFSNNLLKVGGGIIDSTYRGDISICLVNLSFRDYHVKEGEKIAQIVIMPCSNGIPYEVKELTETVRNNNGFGSSDESP